MAIRIFKPTSPGRRFRTDVIKSSLTTARPLKSLTSGITSLVGRSGGTITVRHRGGAFKRLFREIDFKRNKFDIPAKVSTIEYDPNRSANIALLVYADGEKRYILAPDTLDVDMTVLSSKNSIDAKVGNTMPLELMPLGTVIHNIELSPGKGAQMARSAGTSASLVAKDGKYVTLKMPSGERRLVLATCMATVGVVGNIDWKNIKLGKAGRSRHFGRRPQVRGVAMYPSAHPHGGGEGRSGIGMKHPKTPWGKPALGYKTRKRTHTNKYIVKDRRDK